ncbi:unnamed protein product [Protopolystoma xenopodis]|uniref:C2H2-type domain-containing protein n=1 Tax=Protopolystoma xenopodis TaxID=117903 RepID=A0A448WJG9_9PLAT|nr:unnamed protein product [Protopolystoma xenopodis]
MGLHFKGTHLFFISSAGQPEFLDCAYCGATFFSAWELVFHCHIEHNFTIFALPTQSCSSESSAPESSLFAQEVVSCANQDGVLKSHDNNSNPQEEEENDELGWRFDSLNCELEPCELLAREKTIIAANPPEAKSCLNATSVDFFPKESRRLSREPSDSLKHVTEAPEFPDFQDQITPASLLSSTKKEQLSILTEDCLGGRPLSVLSPGFSSPTVSLSRSNGVEGSDTAKTVHDTLLLSEADDNTIV